MTKFIDDKRALEAFDEIAAIVNKYSPTTPVDTLFDALVNCLAKALVSSCRRKSKKDCLYITSAVCGDLKDAVRFYWKKEIEDDLGQIYQRKN
jgi:hypothetical protein